MNFRRKYIFIILFLALNFNLVGSDSTTSITPDPYDDSSFLCVMTSPRENQLALAFYTRDATQYVISSNPTGNTPEQLADNTTLQERVKTLEKEREDSIKRRHEEATARTVSLYQKEKNLSVSQLVNAIKRLQEEKSRLAKENAKLKEENAALKLKMRIS